MGSYTLYDQHAAPHVKTQEGGDTVDHMLIDQGFI